MCHSATPPGGVVRLVGLLLLTLLAVGALDAQTSVASKPGVRPDWRHIGNSAIELSLASPASGAVDRVWFSEDGSHLYVRTGSGRVFETSDYQNWQPSSAAPPTGFTSAPAVHAPPDPRARVLGHRSNPSRLYALAQQVFRSDDGGGSWTNMTAFEHQSIIGGGMRDIAIGPLDPDEVVVANETGLWRSLDGGLSWTGLNDTLPNLPVTRILGVPQSVRGVRLATSSASGAIEWAPGEKQAWRPVADAGAVQEAVARSEYSQALGTQVTAMAISGDFLYAGAADGRIWVSLDRGRTWTPPAPADRGRVESLWADPKDGRLALAALSGPGPRVLRSINGGQFWDDLTADLPEGAVHGIAADRASGTIYGATDRGVLYTKADLNAAAPATNWTSLAGLPATRALDVRLDPDANQLFVAMEGYGVYAAMAPHRLGNLRLVNAADFSQRAAAPGSLLSVLGGAVRTARSGDLTFPVLASSEAESQIQVPFTAQGPSVSLALETRQGSLRVALPVESVSPAIFVDRDGTPLLLNADSGVLIDATAPARSNGRIQILATGLGRVQPDWPAGVPGPAENPPAVVAPVRVLLDGAPLDVTRAVLAPGYIGLYLVEVQLPALVNAGSAELYLVADTQASNRVRIWIEP